MEKGKILVRSSINKRLNYRYVPTLATAGARTGATPRLQNELRVFQ